MRAGRFEKLYGDYRERKAEEELGPPSDEEADEIASDYLGWKSHPATQRHAEQLKAKIVMAEERLVAVANSSVDPNVRAVCGHLVALYGQLKEVE